jgi:hypothetical protein
MCMEDSLYRPEAPAERASSPLNPGIFIPRLLLFPRMHQGWAVKTLIVAYDTNTFIIFAMCQNMYLG